MSGRPSARPGKKPRPGRPPTGPGKRPELPIVAVIHHPPSPPGKTRRIGKGHKRIIFGNRIIQMEGIPVMKFNLRSKKVIK